MMEFTVNSLTLDGAPTLTVTQGGVSSVTSGSSMPVHLEFAPGPRAPGRFLDVQVAGWPASLATPLPVINRVTAS